MLKTHGEKVICYQFVGMEWGIQYAHLTSMLWFWFCICALPCRQYHVCGVAWRQTEFPVRPPIQHHTIYNAGFNVCTPWWSGDYSPSRSIVMSGQDDQYLVSDHHRPKQRLCAVCIIWLHPMGSIGDKICPTGHKPTSNQLHSLLFAPFLFSFKIQSLIWFMPIPKQTTIQLSKLTCRWCLL